MDQLGDQGYASTLSNCPYNLPVVCSTDPHCVSQPDCQQSRLLPAYAHPTRKNEAEISALTEKQHSGRAVQQFIVGLKKLGALYSRTTLHVAVMAADTTTLEV